MSELDQVDLQIVELLRNDGRITIRNISDALDIPESTARDRVRALEERKVISGYRVTVDPHRLGLRIMAWLIVEIPRDEVAEFAQFIDGQPMVLRGYQLSHRPNAFAVKIASPSTQRLTSAVQGWRKRFDFKTMDLLLVDDVRLDEVEAPLQDEDLAFGALNERLLA